MVSSSPYETSVVAYLDVCGLKEAVQKSVRKPDLASELATMLSGIESRCLELNKSQQQSSQVPNLKARAFSDSIIVTCPAVSDNALRLIAWAISAYQMEVAVLHGFFIRGAITVGLHCDRGNICFGPAFIDAYEAEKHRSEIVVFKEYVGDEVDFRDMTYQELLNKLSSKDRDYVSYLHDRYFPSLTD